MKLDLIDAVVIVTGGTDGLGAALAQALVDEGAKVAICGRSPERLAAAEERLRNAGGDVLAVVADVTVPDDLQRLVDGAIDRWGRLDGLVNNAGQSKTGHLEELSDLDWLEDLDLKVMAAVRLVRFALPHLRRSDRASIVNVLNIGAKAPRASSLPTTAARAAGLAITKALANELGPSQVRVNAVLVGLIESAQWRRQAEQRQVSIEQIYAERMQATPVPLGRPGRSAEFADLVTYLLSARSSYITGTAINLDGGASPVV